MVGVHAAKEVAALEKALHAGCPSSTGNTELVGDRVV